MQMRVEVMQEGDRPVIRLIGDSQAFYWLQAAAGNAMNGQAGNEAHVEGGGRIELVPATLAELQAKRPIAHLKANLSGG